MLGQPRVLVVVPTLGNRQDWLKACLTSIRAQSVVAAVRIVAPSSADLDALAAQHGAELRTFDTPGLGKALNFGFNMQDDMGVHEYVTWLGDDDLLAAGSLAATVKALDTKPDANVAFGYCRYIDSEGETLWMFRSPRWAPWYAQYGADFIPQPGSLLRHASLRDVGGIDESFKHAMDLDLFLRLLSGGKFVRLKRELASFRMHESSITTTKPSGEESERARWQHAERRGRALAYQMCRPISRLADKVVVRALRATKPPSQLLAKIARTS